MDTTVKKRKGFLQESFVRGVGAARCQKYKHNSNSIPGTEKSGRNKDSRADNMDPDREMKRRHPGMYDRSPVGTLPELPEKTMAQKRREIKRDETLARDTDSPRNRIS